MSRKAYFNEAARTWDEKYDTPELASFLEKLVLSFGLSPGQKILDVGTGTGILIPYLIQTVGSSGSITAIDYAEEMVKICKSKYSHLRNVTITTQDIEKTTLPPNTYDAVTCFGLFPHLENKEKALGNINRVLKKRGRLIIAHALSSSEIMARHKDASLAVVRDTLPGEREMKRLLNHAGFYDVYIKDESGCYICISKKS
jgi:demethylmenaquinone methyltransferase/2-methoxy-6-polyprenyl-1,4-benzoquinol methylase